MHLPARRETTVAVVLAVVVVIVVVVVVIVDGNFKLRSSPAPETCKKEINFSIQGVSR